jgi:DNA-binding transcriptional LysR family regulator
MELNQLEVFVTVAREGSFSRAALHLHKTQPAVSMALKRLEEALGEPLLVRSGQGLALTHAGRSLLDYAEGMLKMRTEAFDTLKALRGMGQGTLTLVAPAHLGDFLLPDLIHRFHRAHPHISVQLHSGDSERIPGAVLRYDYDFGFIAAEEVVHGLETLLLRTDDLIAVVSPDHPLTRLAPKDLAALCTFPLALYSGTSPLRRKLEAAFRQLGLEPRVAFDLSSLQALKVLVGEGLAIGLLPTLAVAPEVERGALKRIPLPGLSLAQPIRMVYRGDVLLSHAAKAFMGVARDSAEPRGRQVKPSRR